MLNWPVEKLETPDAGTSEIEKEICPQASAIDFVLLTWSVTLTYSVSPTAEPAVPSWTRVVVKGVGNGIQVKLVVRQGSTTVIWKLFWRETEVEVEVAVKVTVWAPTWFN